MGWEGKFTDSKDVLILTLTTHSFMFSCGNYVLSTQCMQGLYQIPGTLWYAQSRQALALGELGVIRLSHHKSRTPAGVPSSACGAPGWPCEACQLLEPNGTSLISRGQECGLWPDPGSSMW